MRLDMFHKEIESLPFGKRLPGAVYLLESHDDGQLLPIRVNLRRNRFGMGPPTGSSPRGHGQLATLPLPSPIIPGGREPAGDYIGEYRFVAGDRRSGGTRPHGGVSASS